MDTSSVRLSRPAKKWLARLQHAYFFSAWDDSISGADTEFARDIGGVKTGSVARRKPFEGMSSDETPLPADVVLRLDDDGRFHGIAEASNSLFWELLGSPLVDAWDAVAFVDRCLDRLGYLRLSPNDERTWLQESQSLPDIIADQVSSSEDAIWDQLGLLAASELRRTCELKDQCCYARSEEGSSSIVDCKRTRHLVRLDVVALFGALYRELYLTYELEAADRVGRFFWMMLEDLLSHPRLTKINGDLKTYSVNRVLYGRTERDAGKPFRDDNRFRVPGCPVGFFIPKSDKLA